MSPATLAKLLEVAVRRLEGESWPTIASSMNWKSRQAARQWATNNLRWYWESIEGREL